MANRYTNPIRTKIHCCSNADLARCRADRVGTLVARFSEVFDKRLDPSDVPIKFSIINMDIAYEDIMHKSRHKRRHNNITWCDLH